LVPALSRG